MLTNPWFKLNNSTFESLKNTEENLKQINEQIIEQWYGIDRALDYKNWSLNLSQVHYPNWLWLIVPEVATNSSLNYNLIKELVNSGFSPDRFYWSPVLFDEFHG